MSVLIGAVIITTLLAIYGAIIVYENRKDTKNKQKDTEQIKTKNEQQDLSDKS